MKPLIYILSILFPTLLLAQHGSIKLDTFKIGHCAPYVGGLKGGRIKKEKMLAAKKVDLKWCDDSGEIVRFSLTIQYSTKESYALIDKPKVIETNPSTSSYFTGEMLEEIKKAPKGSTVFITQIVKGWHNDSEERLTNDIELVLQ